MKSKLLPAAILLVLGSVPLSAQLPGRFTDALKTVRWVAYSPTGDSADLGPVNAKDADKKRGEITKDLTVLQKAGFGGIVTYGCDGLKAEIPKLARDAGIKHIIMGIFDPRKVEEIANAKAATDLVDGYCVGNEGIGPSYTLDVLLPVMQELRSWTGKPVTTSEQIEKYLGDKVPGLIEAGDWLFPNVHPYFHRQFEEPAASQWTKEQVEKLQAKAAEKLGKEKIVICKEVGFPTTGDNQNHVSEELQASYYSDLRALNVPFVYFEAFDQVWKKHLPVEPYWGLFTKDRTPKKVVSMLAGATLASGLQITKPTAGQKLPCMIGGDGGIVDISGTAVGLSASTKLLFFVFPQDPGVFGWFLQLNPNSVRLNSDGTWIARAQIGNRSYPPPDGMKINLMLRAVDVAAANNLLQEQKKHPDSPIQESDLPEASAVVQLNDVVLEVPKH